MPNHKFVPLVLLVACGIKALVLGASGADIGVLAVLASLAAFYEYNLERSIVKELKKQTELQNIAIENTYKEVQQLKTFASSMKMAQTIPTRAGNGKSAFTF